MSIIFDIQKASKDLNDAINTHEIIKKDRENKFAKLIMAGTGHKINGTKIGRDYTYVYVCDGETGRKYLSGHEITIYTRSNYKTPNKISFGLNYFSTTSTGRETIYDYLEVLGTLASNVRDGECDLLCNTLLRYRNDIIDAEAKINEAERNYDRINTSISNEIKENSKKELVVGDIFVKLRKGRYEPVVEFTRIVKITKKRVQVKNDEPSVGTLLSDNKLPDFVYSKVRHVDKELFDPYLSGWINVKDITTDLLFEYIAIIYIKQFVGKESYLSKDILFARFKNNFYNTDKVNELEDLFDKYYELATK